MPIVDVTLVQAPDVRAPDQAARALAGAVGQAVGAPSGRLWLRLHRLAIEDYAENGAVMAPEDLPVFVTVLHARPPAGDALAAEAAAVTRAVAACLACAESQVHLEYAAAGAGRIAFGGHLVR